MARNTLDTHCTKKLWHAVIAMCAISLLGQARSAEPINVDSLECDTSNPTRPYDELLHGLLTSEEPNRCEDYLFNAQRLIPDLYRATEYDSIRSIVDYVEACCPYTDFSRIRHLMHIREGKFDEQDLDTTLAWNMMAYHGWRHASPNIDYECRYRVFIYGCTTGDAYEEFVVSEAAELATRTDAASTEHILCLYYAGKFDEMYVHLREDAHAKTLPGSIYRECVDELVQGARNGGQWNLWAGIWNPTGDASLLGPHPEIGWSLKLPAHEVLIQPEVAFRFADTRKKYVTVHNGVTEQTNAFLGMYLGVSIGATVFRSQSIEFEIAGGGGFDCMGPQGGDAEDWSGSNSWNLNTTARLHFFLDRRQSRWLGVQFRYNAMDYSVTGGSDLPGDAIGLSLVYGGLFWTNELNQLDMLQHKGRYR